MPGPSIDLNRYVPALLTFIGNKYTGGSAVLYRRMFDLGIVEWRVMVMLAVEPDIPGARVCQVTGMDKAAVSRALRILERRGLVAIRRDYAHVRRQLLALTEAGWAVYERMKDIALERERLLLEPFDADERARLIALLHRLLDQVPHANGWEPPDAPPPARRG